MDVAADPSARTIEAGADDRARRIVLGALLAELLVLVATGVALFFVYRPSGARSFAGVDAATDPVVTALRTVHRVGALLTVLTATGALVVFVSTRARKLTWAMAGGLVVTVVAASVSGYLLPWDQLALRAVTVGADPSGHRPMFSDRVRFVLIGGTEVDPDTIVRWLGVHAVVLTPLALLLVVALWRQRQRRQQPAG